MQLLEDWLAGGAITECNYVQHIYFQNDELSTLLWLHWIGVLQTCKNFNNNGSCEAHCPPLMRYNQDTYRHEPNPDAKYAFGPLCVDKCPGE